MKHLLFIATISISLIADAQVAVYKYRVSGSATGAGAVQRASTSGYLVQDLAHANIVEIDLFPATKHYQEVRNQFLINSALAPNGKQIEVFLRSTNWYDGSALLHTESAYLKGTCVSVDIGLISGQRYQIPRTMTILGRSTYPDPRSGLTLLEELTGTLQLDMKNTTFYNGTPFDLDGTVSLIETDLLGQGYTPQ
jgi:hypothetical protein